MTCSSVHISSWRGLWLLNFCHPPETICSGLHCWKERTMGKKILSKFLGSSAWETMVLSSAGLFRKCYQNVYPCVQPTAEGTQRLNFLGQCRFQESLWYLRHCFICLKTVGRAWKLLPLRGLQSRDQTSQLSFPQIGMLLPQYTQRGKKGPRAINPFPRLWGLSTRFLTHKITMKN